MQSDEGEDKERRSCRLSRRTSHQTILIAKSKRMMVAIKKGDKKWKK
jgi:hypothetical protein